MLLTGGRLRLKRVLLLLLQVKGDLSSPHPTMLQNGDLINIVYAVRVLAQAPGLQHALSGFEWQAPPSHCGACPLVHSRTQCLESCSHSSWLRGYCRPHTVCKKTATVCIPAASCPVSKRCSHGCAVSSCSACWCSHLLPNLRREQFCGPVVQFGGGATVVRWPRESHVRQKVAEVKSVHFPSFSWVHDFPATQNWAVVPQTPCVWSLGVSLPSAVQPDFHFNLAARSHS